MQSRVLVAIPAFNEEKFIEPLLREISAIVPLDHIIVVNDGSTDRTRDIATSLNVKVIDHVRNSGKGEAINSAFFFARQAHFDWILFLDADGQHPPRYIAEFLKMIELNKVDVVLANRRDRRRYMPLHRQLSNGITSILVSLCAGQRILDSQCGFRAIRLAKLHKLEFQSTGFQVESELLIKLGKSGARFEHVPIRTVYGDETSSINVVRDTLKFAKLILKSFWW